jgi:hypothetical protein
MTGEQNTMPGVDHEPQAATAAKTISARDGLIFAAAVLTIMCTLAFVPTGSLFSRSVAVVAILIGLGQIPIALTWKCKGHWGVKEARNTLIGTLAARVLATALTATIGFSVGSTEWVVLIATPALVAVAISMWREPGNIERRIKQHAAKEQLEPAEETQPTHEVQPTEGTETSEVTKATEIPKRSITFDPNTKIFTIRVLDGVSNAAQDLASLGKYVRLAPIGILVVTLVMLILCSATLAIGLLSGKWIGEPAKVKPPTPTVSIATPASGATYTEGQLVDASYTCADGTGGPGIRSCSGSVANGDAITTSSSGSHTFTVTVTSNDDLSTTQTVHYTVMAPRSPTPTSTTTTAQKTTSKATDAPAATCEKVHQHSGATRKALNAIEALYELKLETDTIEPGCFGQIVRHEYARRHEAFFTTVGTAPGSAEKTSFGIDSEHFGTVILPWSVGPEIEALIKKIGPVGGIEHYPYYPITGGGGYLLVRSWIGTIVFVRRQESEPFQELKPTQARAWIASMKSNDYMWLWPSSPEPGPKGEQLIQLRSTESVIKATITYHPGSGTSEQDEVKYPASPVVELNLVELGELAKTA